MPNPKGHKDSLKPFKRVDKDESTELIHARILQSDAAWLKGLPDGVSHHVRQAVSLYREMVMVGEDEGETVEDIQGWLKSLAEDE